MNTNDKKKLLLKTGKEVFATHGFTNVGLTELLKKAGIPKGSFYYYFSSKEEYGVEVIQYYIKNYTAYMASLIHNSQLSGKECLFTYWQDLQDSQCVNHYQGRCLIIKLGSEVSDYSEAMRKAFCEGVDQILSLIERFITLGQKDGSIPQNIKAAMVAQQLYQLWLGACLLVKIQRKSTPFDYAKKMSSFLLEKEN